MAKTVYENNEVEITVENFDEFEAKINVNGKNLIWISRDDAEKFRSELCEVLERYRI